ncbi:hypothetical protein [Thioalkalivibrio sp. ALJT]|uniref:hypothetical protein n=1 Tax=Thioalkalivibrio sp. ALJT TaxID=1158146 RepID=UPI000365E9F4|nr:hypothetical protein [Thioalkalivibrio sp. ALJT]
MAQPRQVRSIPAVRSDHAPHGEYNRIATTEELLQRIPLVGHRYHDDPKGDAD